MNTFKKLALLGCALLCIGKPGNASSLPYKNTLLSGARTSQPVIVTISNKTGHMWIWVKVHADQPRKIWKSESFTLLTNRETDVYVYIKDPTRSTNRLYYEVIFGGAG